MFSNTCMSDQGVDTGIGSVVDVLSPVNSRGVPPDDGVDCHQIDPDGEKYIRGTSLGCPKNLKFSTAIM